MSIPIYTLSDYGRAVTWRTWKSLGGCGLANNTMAVLTGDDMTLGEIADQCPFSGRGLARFATERLGIHEMVEVPGNMPVRYVRSRR